MSKPSCLFLSRKDDRNGIAKLLKSFGYRVMLTTSPSDALDGFQRDIFDLVLIEEDQDAHPGWDYAITFVQTLPDHRSRIFLMCSSPHPPNVDLRRHGIGILMRPFTKMTARAQLQTNHLIATFIGSW
ncbi:MAG: Response regulator receiver domain [Candidatus Parcubacteria bacterium]